MESISVLKASAEGSLRAYRIDLSYIGSDFYGWQSQPNGKTVQDALEAALYTALRKKVRVVGASRTDTGVHAEHQVASFRTEEDLDCRRLQRSLQALLPASIGVSRVAPIPFDFHPITSAHSKLYRYRIWRGPGTNAFLKPYCWSVPQPLDLSALTKASQQLLGKHDFRSFAAVDGSSKTFHRTILDLKWVERSPGLLEFLILGEGFLKQMVRNLVGTLVEVGQGKRSVDAIPLILAAGDRREAGQTAPALGLSLVEIYYEPKTSIDPRFLNSQDEMSFSLRF